MGKAVPVCPWCGKGHLRQTQWFRALQCDACRTGSAELTGPGRIGCCVPGCKATRGDRKNDKLTETAEWICSRHWQTVPAKLKRRRTAARRLARKGQAERADRIDAYLWRECKRAAIEREVGIR